MWEKRVEKYGVEIVAAIFFTSILPFGAMELWDLAFFCCLINSSAITFIPLRGIGRIVVVSPPSSSFFVYIFLLAALLLPMSIPQLIPGLPFAPSFPYVFGKSLFMFLVSGYDFFLF